MTPYIFLVTVALLMMLPMQNAFAAAQTNMTSLSLNISKAFANYFIQALPKLLHEIPTTCIKVREMSPTVIPTTNKTLAENPLAVLIYTAGMKEALRQCEAIGK